MSLRFSRIARSASLGAVMLAASASDGLASGTQFRVTDLGVRQGVALNDAGQVALNQVSSAWSGSDLAPFTTQTAGWTTTTDALLYSSYGPHAGLVLSPANAIATSDPQDYTAGTTGHPVTPTTALGLTQSGEMLVNAGGFYQGTYSADLGNARLVADGSTGLQPFAMDNSGRLIAVANPTGSQDQGAVIQGLKVSEFLKLADGTPIVPTGMNSDGRILGYYDTQKPGADDPTPHPVVVDHGKITQFPTLEGRYAAIAGINSAGDVAGSWLSKSGYYPPHAFAMIGGVARDLGTLGSGLTSRATGINDLGQVVGDSDIKVRNYNNYMSPLDIAKMQHAFLYEAGKMIDLNTLVSPSLHLTLTDAISINDKGQILVEGYAGSNYLESSYLLTPKTMFAPADVTTAPEPTTLAILGLGAVVVGLRRRLAGRA